MRSRLRASDFTHSRSFSAPNIPSLRLTPPTPHGSFHETDYDSDDSVPSSAAAMPRPSRYRRSGARTSSHPYNSSTSASTSSASQPSSSPTSSSHQHFQSINPGYFFGTCIGKKVAAFSVVITDDDIITIQGKLIPSPYPSQTLQERRSLSQPSSPLIFQPPIDPSVAALGLRNPPAKTTDGVVDALPNNAAFREHEHIVPIMNQQPVQMSSVFINPYMDFQQSMPIWPVEQIPISHG